MPKKITSPVELWPGNVILKDPIPMMLVLEYERAISASQSKFCKVGRELLLDYIRSEAEDRSEPLRKLEEHTAACPEYVPAKTGTEADSILLPVVIKYVDEWNLENFPNPVNSDTFPGTPKMQSDTLMDWLVTEITKIYEGGDVTKDEKNE